MMIAMPLPSDMPMLESSASARNITADESIAVALFEAEFEVTLEAAGFSASPEIQSTLPAVPQDRGRLSAIGMPQIEPLGVKTTRIAEADLTKVGSFVLDPPAQSNFSSSELFAKTEGGVLGKALYADMPSEAPRVQSVDAAEVLAGTQSVFDQKPKNVREDRPRDSVSRPKSLVQESPNEGSRGDSRERVLQPLQNNEDVRRPNTDLASVVSSEPKAIGDKGIAPVDQGQSVPTGSRKLGAYQGIDIPAPGNGPVNLSDIDQTQPVVALADKPKPEMVVNVSTIAQSNTQKRLLPEIDLIPQVGVGQDGSEKVKVVQTVPQKPESGVLISTPVRNKDLISVAPGEKPSIEAEDPPSRDRREIPKSPTPNFNSDTSKLVGQTQDQFKALQSYSEAQQGKSPATELVLQIDNRSPGDKPAPLPTAVPVTPVAMVDEPTKLEFEPLTFKIDTDGELKANSTGKVSETAMMRPEPPRPVVHQLAEAVRNASSGTIEVKLAPEELGRVKLSLTPSEAGLAVTVLADRPETLDLIRRNIEVFAQDLRQQGHQNLSFQFGQHDRNRQSGGDLNDQFEKAETSPTEQPPYTQRVIPTLATTNGRLDLRI